VASNAAVRIRGFEVRNKKNWLAGFGLQRVRLTWSVLKGNLEVMTDRCNINAMDDWVIEVSSMSARTSGGRTTKSLKNSNP
jgi:hypothetical protein